MPPMSNLMSDDLDEVVAAASRGETAALCAIYEALSPRVCGFLRIRGAEDPEGLTNDTFVKVLPRIREITGGYRGLRAFTFLVAHGLLVDELRRRGRRPVHLLYEASEDPRTDVSAEDRALDRVGSGTALQLLGLLPDDQKTVIVLRVLGELTVAETASAIGRSEGAVKKLQSKGLSALRVLLASENGCRGGELGSRR